MGSQAVQGGGGTTAAAYTDPAAPPGATISQLLPSSDPQVTADRQQAYAALVQAAKDYVGANYSSESFTDFLDLNTGVTIKPAHLFGLQTVADAAVLQDQAKYLGTASPSQGLLAALQDVLDLLNRVDAERQNVYAFLVVQDSWIQNYINNLLGQNVLYTIAQTIVDNQSQDNRPPYLEPPSPSTPYSMDADAAIQGGRQALAGLQAILTPLLFAGPAAPFAGVLFGLVNLGATIGATYASDTLKKTAAQMPTLIIPPDNNQISTLILAAGTYQAQLISSLNAQQNLANNPQFYSPLFSNMGLLNALANLNPLVLDSTMPNEELGTENPITAAVTYSAWQALLPDYFHWVPIDPTTESQSRNFDNFYPGATPASPGNALDQLEAMQSTGLDVQVMSWGDGSGVPTSGNNLVIVGIDNNGLLHIRIFDAGGNEVTDTDETKLPGTQASAISALKQQIPNLLPPHVLTRAEKVQLISETTSIVDLTPTGTYDYPGFNQTPQIAISGQTSNPTGFTYNNYYPTSMAVFPAGTASGVGTAHPERFYSLVQADLSEGANGSDSYYFGGADRPANFSFAYGGLGLYVLGWELVDANGVEIDPRTAAMVFPTGSAIQPVTDGPALAAAGGGWYVNLGPPTPLPSNSSTLFETRANPSEVYFDWFHQATLASYLPLSGNLTVGAIIGLDPSGQQDNDINVAAPSYKVVYSPITSAPPPVSLDVIKDPSFEQVSVAAAPGRVQVPPERLSLDLHRRLRHRRVRGQQ
jgi:hypothetical protein